MAEGALDFPEVKPNIVLKLSVGTKHVAIDLLGLPVKHNHSVESILKLQKNAELHPPDPVEMARSTKLLSTQVNQVAACLMVRICSLSPASHRQH